MTNLFSNTPTALPDRVGVMLLPGTCLFPQALVPLFLFEPRYRLMLECALEDHRCFAINGNEDSESPGGVGGVGIVRACVKNSDGTSHLVLQGLERVRFTNWTQEEPFPEAGIEILASSGEDAPESHRLARQVQAACLALKEGGLNLPNGFEQFFSKVEHPGVFCDVVSSTLISDPAMRQALLEETDLPRRLSLLDRCLRLADSGAGGN